MTGRAQQVTAVCASAAGLAQLVVLLGWLLAPVLQPLRPFHRAWGRHWLAGRLLGPADHAPDLPERMARRARLDAPVGHCRLLPCDGEGITVWEHWMRCGRTRP